ncbi:MAG: helical backbone metal receptor [Dehalococcoidia bacterium]
MTEPSRIVSLVPSLTELVFWLGAGDRLVGRTRFCEEPAGEVERVPIIGGTKNPHVERIVALQPDLVIANKEENRREDVDALRAAGLAVLLTDPNTVPEAIEMVEQVGALLGAAERASALAGDTREAMDELPGAPSRVFAAVWWNPLMGLGAESYGHDLLTHAGAENVLGSRARYPAVSLQEVAALGPDLVLLPDEPFPFKSEHSAAFAAIAPVRIIDGKLLWWYGPRMPSAIRELRRLLSEVSQRA